MLERHFRRRLIDDIAHRGQAQNIFLIRKIYNSRSVVCAFGGLDTLLPVLTTRRAEIARRLTRPLVLEDGRPPRLLMATLLTASGFVIAAIVWGSVTQVREVTVAQGQIIPRGQVQTIQHLEGGIVAEIFVHEGMTVTGQQPLIRLRPEAATSERDQFEARRANLKLQLDTCRSAKPGRNTGFRQSWPRSSLTWPRSRRNYTSVPSSRGGRSAQPLKPNWRRSAAKSPR